MSYGHWPIWAEHVNTPLTGIIFIFISIFEILIYNGIRLRTLIKTQPKLNLTQLQSNMEREVTNDC